MPKKTKKKKKTRPSPTRQRPTRPKAPRTNTRGRYKATERSRGREASELDPAELADLLNRIRLEDEYAKNSVAKAIMAVNASIERLRNDIANERETVDHHRMLSTASAKLGMLLDLAGITSLRKARKGISL